MKELSKMTPAERAAACKAVCKGEGEFIEKDGETYYKEGK
jgi:hypothetical protein